MPILPYTSSPVYPISIANGGTGSTTKNFVDLSTIQSSIGGAKTFTSAMAINGSADVSQLTVKNNGTQTASLVQLLRSDNSVFGTIGVNSAAGDALAINSPLAGTGLFLQAIGSGSKVSALRIVGNGGGWTDNSDTAYFQIDYNATHFASILSGTYGADANFTRLQFVSAHTTMSNYLYNTTPVPTAVFEVQNNTNGTTPMLINAATGQSADLFNIQINGSTKFGIDSVGNLKLTGGSGVLSITASSDGGDYNIFSANGTQTLAFYGSGGNTLNLNLLDGSLSTGGTVRLTNAGALQNIVSLGIVTGSNATAGTGTLSGGTVTISTTAVTASSLIFLTDTASTLTNVGTLSAPAASIVAGTSFVVKSTNVLDSSTFNWFFIN